MMPNQTMPFICIDFRENQSGIPELLTKKGCRVVVETLKVGDYIINDQVLVERKTKDDFVLSLMQNRLFKQCARMRRTNFISTLLVEGNPYHTTHDISREAIRGALLSISLSWQIPINYSVCQEDTANLLIVIANQCLKDESRFKRGGYKPKRLNKQQLFFLQGLPLIGSKLACELYNHFDSLSDIIAADENELAAIAGIGKERAGKIREFLLASLGKKQ